MAFLKKNYLVIYLLLNIKRGFNTQLYKIPANKIRLKKLFRMQRILFNRTKLINFNKHMFNSLRINLNKLGLISLIEKLYNKNIAFSLVELKSVHLSSDILSSAV